MPFFTQASKEAWLAAQNPDKLQPSDDSHTSYIAGITFTDQQVHSYCG